MWGPAEFTSNGILKDYDGDARLHQIEVPTLYTCGEHDEATPAACRDFASLTPNARVAVAEGQAAQRFDACTAMVGVDYEADLAAFIDLDDDGKPSAGEPYGGYLDGPLGRDSEGKSISIRISETIPE